MMDLRGLARDLLPPLLVRILRGQRRELSAQERALDTFYRSLVRPGALCFDVGANVGHRVASLRRLGCPVVALEPQLSTFQALRRRFRHDPGVTLYRKAAGATPGPATMFVSDAHVLSSLSREFIETTTASGRFKGYTWPTTEQVWVVTLDEMIATHGVPDFIKIDVEGFELEVVRGLSQPVRLIALEWAAEVTDHILGCIEHLATLAPVVYNFSWGESFVLARQEWLDRRQMEDVLQRFHEEVSLFADVYVRMDVS